MSESDRTNPYASPREESAPAELGDGEVDLTWAIRGTTLMIWTLAPPLVALAVVMQVNQMFAMALLTLAIVSYLLVLLSAAICYFFAPGELGLRLSAVVAGVGVLALGLLALLLATPRPWLLPYSVPIQVTCSFLFHLGPAAQLWILRSLAVHRGQTILASLTFAVIAMWGVGFAGEMLREYAFRRMEQRDLQLPPGLLNLGTTVALLGWAVAWVGTGLLAYFIRRELVVERPPAEQDVEGLKESELVKMGNTNLH